MLTQNWPLTRSSSAILRRCASVSGQIVPLLGFHSNLHTRLPAAARKRLLFGCILFSLTVTVCWSFQSQGAVRVYAWLIFLLLLCFSLLDPTGYQYARYTHYTLFLTEELLGGGSICICWKSVCTVCVYGRRGLLFFSTRHFSACAYMTEADALVLFPPRLLHAF